MKTIILILCIILWTLNVSNAQSSKIDIDGNSAIEVFEDSKICADEVSVQNGSSLWAYDYGQIKHSDCSVILTPTGSGTITLPIEISDSVTLPTEFTVETAYPNPFNPTTNIKYGIPESSDVKILLFNIQGQLINILFDNTQETGWYTITWNGLLMSGKTAPAGIYFIKILSSSNNKTDFKTIKISLIK